MKYLGLSLIFIPLYLQAISIYLPFCDSPCQTTYGPGSYGKSCSDIRYRDGWSWKPCYKNTANSPKSLKGRSRVRA